MLSNDSFWYFQVHRIYRSTGASFQKAQQEFATGVMRNEAVQNVAANAASGAARGAAQQYGSGNRYWGLQHYGICSPYIRNVQWEFCFTGETDIPIPWTENVRVHTMDQCNGFCQSPNRTASQTVDVICYFLMYSPSP